MEYEDLIDWVMELTESEAYIDHAVFLAKHSSMSNGEIRDTLESLYWGAANDYGG
jgi:hypothetical protein